MKSVSKCTDLSISSPSKKSHDFPWLTPWSPHSGLFPVNPTTHPSCLAALGNDPLKWQVFFVLFSFLFGCIESSGQWSPKMTSVFLFCFILFLAALGLHCYACGLSLVAVSGGYSSLRCVGFSCCRTRALDARASVLVARGLSSCGVQPGLLCGMWDLPGPGIEPASPALAGGFLTTAPPGKSQDQQNS